MLGNYLLTFQRGLHFGMSQNEKRTNNLGWLSNYYIVYILGMFYIIFS